jgi:hypothetical protein
MKLADILKGMDLPPDSCYPLGADDTVWCATHANSTMVECAAQKDALLARKVAALEAASRSLSERETEIAELKALIAGAVPYIRQHDKPQWLLRAEAALRASEKGP